MSEFMKIISLEARAVGKNWKFPILDHLHIRLLNKMLVLDVCNISTYKTIHSLNDEKTSLIT